MKQQAAISKIKTPEDFKRFVASVEAKPNYKKPLAFGLCRVEYGQVQKDKIITCSFPVTNWSENFGSAALFCHAANVPSDATEYVGEVTADFISKCSAAFAPFKKDAKGASHRNVQVIEHLKKIAKSKKSELKKFRLVVLFADAEAQSIPAIYLKLQAMSERKVKPRSINLAGIFGKLENLAWAGNSAYELQYLRDNEIALKLDGKFPAIEYVDKFPRYLMRVIPDSSIRVLDSSRVRFGAHLAEGTTVMPGASYINFNAGTLGPTMVEGRISSSAIVGAHSDVGGGASIMGVLSGGNSTPISIGEKCLLGANSVTGIPMGDGCIIDAGIAVLAGTKLAIAEAEASKIEAVNPGKKIAVKAQKEGSWLVIKASELAGWNGLHFRQDSTNGRMIAQRSKKEIVLNQDLHGAKKAVGA